MPTNESGEEVVAGNASDSSPEPTWMDLLGSETGKLARADRTIGEPEEPEEEPEEEDEEAPDDEEEEDVPPSTPPAESTAPVDVDALAQMVRENRGRIAEVKPRDRAKVLDRVFELEAATTRRAMELAHEQGLQRGRQEAAIAAAEAEVDALRADDPEEFANWQTQYPDRAAAYWQRKRIALQGPDPRQVEAARINHAAAPILAKLADLPEARARLEERAMREPGRYEATAEGLARLTEDVAEELAEAKAAKRIKAEEPARKAAEKRENGAERRSSLPRPDTSGGIPQEGRDPYEGKSYLEIAAMGVHEAMKTPRRAAPTR